jgi:hypothetical protein
MMTSSQAAIAIEAKYAEQRYQEVGDWLREGEQANRRVVLEGWLTLISSVASASLDKKSVTGLPYQLIHRAASVCAVTAPSRWVVYQIFAGAVGHYVDDLLQLARLLGSSAALRFGVFSCPFAAQPAHEALQARWSCGERELGPDVRASLINGPLFSFEQRDWVLVAP